MLKIFRQFIAIFTLLFLHCNVSYAQNWLFRSNLSIPFPVVVNGDTTYCTTAGFRSMWNRDKITITYLKKGEAAPESHLSVIKKLMKDYRKMAHIYIVDVKENPSIEFVLGSEAPKTIVSKGRKIIAESDGIIPEDDLRKMILLN